MRRDLVKETRGRSTRESRNRNAFNWEVRDGEEIAGPLMAARRVEGRRRSRSTTRSGGAQTRRREASMLVMKKRVLATLHARLHRASLVEAMEIFVLLCAEGETSWTWNKWAWREKREKV